MCLTHRDERNEDEIDDGQVLVMDVLRSLSEGQSRQGYSSRDAFDTNVPSNLLHHNN